LSNNQYTIDSSSLIYGWNTYPPDIFPGIWDHLEALIDKKIIFATDEVRVELDKKQDDLHEWVKAQSDFFVPHDIEIQEHVLQVLSNFPGLYDLKKGKSGADPFVIAHAIQNNYTVVTQEGWSNNPDKPKIPNVCKEYDIRCINLLALMREKKITLSK